MRCVAIIQARMTSTRLPGKVLSDLVGRPMIAQQLARVRCCRNLDEIVVATTTNATDEPIAALVRAEGMACFRGEEKDVLGRYLAAARSANADLVVRLTADCPLIDAEVIDRVVTAITDRKVYCDYASNTMRRTFPQGLDVEAFWIDVLERMARLAESTPAREHVTWFLHRERPDLFLTYNVADVVDNSDLRWTVDTLDDLELVRRIYFRAGLPAHARSYQELVDLVRADDELVTLNAHVIQKEA